MNVAAKPTVHTIGLMHWGDGIVDVKNMIMLTELLFEEFPLAKPLESVAFC